MMEGLLHYMLLNIRYFFNNFKMLKLKIKWDCQKQIENYVDNFFFKYDNQKKKKFAKTRCNHQKPILDLGSA